MSDTVQPTVLTGPAEEIDKIRDVSTTAADTVVLAVHLGYLTAAAIEDADTEQLDMLRGDAKQFLQKNATKPDLTNRYLTYLRTVRGQAWNPAQGWQDAIAKLYPDRTSPE